MYKWLWYNLDTSILNQSRLSHMSSKQYLTMEQFEKEQLHRAKEEDPRFAEPSRITDGGYVALLAQQALDEWGEK